jgi:biopolymer transport protein ExbD
MAGATVNTGGQGGRKALDSEINMIPMIDLLMVTISFLLITAVWVHMSRVDANAQVPGTDKPCTDDECKPPRVLHVEMRDPAKFLLYWSESGHEIARTEIPRKDIIDTVGHAKLVRFPGLEEEIAKEWREYGKHRDPSDRDLDRLVLHTDDASSYAHVIGAIDAVKGVERPIQLAKKTGTTSAFHVTFSAK